MFEALCKIWADGVKFKTETEEKALLKTFSEKLDEECKFMNPKEVQLEPGYYGKQIEEILEKDYSVERFANLIITVNNYNILAKQKINPYDLLCRVGRAKICINFSGRLARLPL